MRYDTNSRLVISRDKTTISTIFSIYHILTLLERPAMLVYSEEETKLIKINKKPSEIISVDFDFKTLENKIYTWFYQSNKLYKPSYPLLFLNDEETKVFLKSYATAVLYFTKQKYNCISQQQQLELKALFKVLMFELN